jgi:hypothetical protein
MKQINWLQAIVLGILGIILGLNMSVPIPPLTPIVLPMLIGIAAFLIIYRLVEYTGKLEAGPNIDQPLFGVIYLITIIILTGLAHSISIGNEDIATSAISFGSTITTLYFDLIIVLWPVVLGSALITGLWILALIFEA